MIEISDMKTGYNDRSIVRIDRLILQNGEIAVIVGKNGSGKSTLLRAVAGLLPHQGGIFCDGTEIRELSSRERAGRISYLPQHLTIPEMSVKTLVSHGRFCRMGFSRTLTAQDRRIVGNAMKIAEVEHLREKPLSLLSGGERQRAYLAMTIAQDSPMMLLDEPDTYMDVTHRRDLLSILGRLKAQGRGIVMTSHDLPFAFLAADRICVMKDGQIVADGTPDIISSMTDMLRRAMGTGMKKVSEPGFLYPYMMEELSEKI
ncbi:MAG: ABC transporter ATP-binding protein [Lachnospiraceae bacterium]|nr:ABC transporter ATP-binding protein [Lachnospiraceae bacterium]